MGSSTVTGPFVASIDQGTTSSRFIIFDKNFSPVVTESIELSSVYRKPGWVEFDPAKMIEDVNSIIEQSISKFNGMGFSTSEIVCVGITCQRETLVVWNKNTGKPVYDAIGWQDIRTSATVDNLSESAGKLGSSTFKRVCGLNISTYFTTVKLHWLLHNVPAVKKYYDDDELMFGTIDTWLLYCLTGGVKGGVYVTDVTNASRTMLMDINTLEWSDTMLKFFNIKKKLLPKIVSCSERYGLFASGPLKNTPLTGCMGDQQASLLGHLAINPGQCKNTYGTGIFMLCNTGEKPIFSDKGLLTTVAWKLGPKSTPLYAIEGSISIGGSAIKWFRDNLNIISSYEEADKLVEKVYDDESEVFFVPAFSGLFSPYWDSAARGAIIGITHNTTRAEIVKSGFEAMAYQTRDILDIMHESSGYDITSIIVDGGVTKSNVGMQIQSDILGIGLEASRMPEVTALGSALAAGMAVGVWSLDSLPEKPEGKVYTSKISSSTRNTLLKKWKKALSRSMKWETA